MKFIKILFITSLYAIFISCFSTTKTNNTDNNINIQQDHSFNANNHVNHQEIMINILRAKIENLKLILLIFYLKNE